MSSLQTFIEKVITENKEDRSFIFNNGSESIQYSINTSPQGIRYFDFQYQPSYGPRQVYRYPINPHNNTPIFNNRNIYFNNFISNQRIPLLNSLVKDYEEKHSPNRKNANHQTAQATHTKKNEPVTDTTTKQSDRKQIENKKIENNSQIKPEKQPETENFKAAYVEKLNDQKYLDSDIKKLKSFKLLNKNIIPHQSQNISPILYATAIANKDYFERLKNAGAIIPDHILHYAAEQNVSQEFIDFILDKNLSLINKKNKSGETPLISAVKANNAEAVKTLLKQKVININAKDNSGHDAKHYAKENKAILALLGEEEKAATAPQQKASKKIDNYLYASYATSIALTIIGLLTINVITYVGLGLLATSLMAAIIYDEKEQTQENSALQNQEPFKTQEPSIEISKNNAEKLEAKSQDPTEISR